MRFRLDLKLGILFFLCSLLLIGLPELEAAAGSENLVSRIQLTVIGTVVNSQNIPIEDAAVSVSVNQETQAIVVGEEEQERVFTGKNGRFITQLTLTTDPSYLSDLSITVSKSGYKTRHIRIHAEHLFCKINDCFARVGFLTLQRVLNQAFYLSTAIFVVIFGMISFNVLHETIAAFLGAASMLGISYFVGSFYPNFWIIGFHKAVEYIDFDVIFLLLGMMIFMAIMSQTGVFQWLAFQTFKLGKGSSFIVAIILILITGVISSVLNDTTVMLLMTPISIQIALALNIRPEAIVIPEILASNIGGAATLIGTPPNTIIGSYVGIGFTEMLVNMLPISVLSMGILVVMTRWLYKDQFLRDDQDTSEALYDQLEKSSQITDRPLLVKSLLLFAITLILFFIEDYFHLPPAVVALIGASALLLWVQPNISKMLREVDWTTLVFFMSLFMMVGGIQEAGLIQLIADLVRQLAGGSLLLATILIIWVSAFASAIVANIPFTAAIIPVTVFLTTQIPGAENNVLYWALALGAGLGGNATYIGSAPNIVAVGILDRAGYRIKFGDFSKIGVPVTFVTILFSSIWILLRYVWIGF
jgi:Na+/H+ antiporter NhaD/arsenite permease-like protein